jgi:hypothetical protein
MLGITLEYSEDRLPPDDQDLRHRNMRYSESCVGSGIPCAGEVSRRTVLSIRRDPDLDVRAGRVEIDSAIVAMLTVIESERLALLRGCKHNPCVQPTRRE